MNWKGFSDAQATIVINLERSKEELWQNLDKDARWGVNKARKEGLTIKLAGQEQDWHDFYNLYVETIERGGIKASSYQEIRKENAVLFLCMHSGKIIAGAVAIQKLEKLSLFLNASLHEFLKFQPNNLLYWHLMEYGKEKGMKQFDLGGYQLNAGKGSKLYEINRFKERWGGEIVKYKIHSKNPFYILGRKIIRTFPFAKKLWDRMK